MQGKESNNKKLSSPTELYKSTKRSSADLGNAQRKLSLLSDKTDNSITKVLCNNLNFPVSAGKDNVRMIDRSFEKNNGDQSFEGGIHHETNDGTDSGVEVIRALSSNGSNSDRATPVQSCGSSLVSYSSEPEIDRGSECESESSDKTRLKKGSDSGGSNIWKIKKNYGKTERSRLGSRKTSCYEGEGTSESCSETSSTHEAVTPDQLNPSLDFKRSNRFRDVKNSESGKSSMVRRSESMTRNGIYEKSSVRSHSGVRISSSASKVNSGSKSGQISSRSVKTGVAEKPDSKGNKVKSSEKWSSSSQKTQTSGARIRVSSVADPTRRNSSAVMSSSLTSGSIEESCKNDISEIKSNALDKYGTLPRRQKKKSVVSEPLSISVVQTSLSRSNSTSREPNLNKTVTLRNQKLKEKNKTLPPYPKIKKNSRKTIIYHEVSVQTLITNRDISCTSSGIQINEKKTQEGTCQKEDKEIQVRTLEIIFSF